LLARDVFALRADYDVTYAGFPKAVHFALSQRRFPERDVNGKKGTVCRIAIQGWHGL
jgi:hypothetical protein